MISVRKRQLLVAIITCAMICAACSARPSVPSEIIGTWKAGDEDSAGVSIEFTSKTIIISSDLGVIENAITKINSEKGRLPDSTQYSVYYADRNKASNLMSILYSPEDGGTLRFKSEQDMVWKRER